MRQFSIRALAYAVFFVGICFGANSYAGWFGSSDAISVPESKIPNPNAPAVKFAATLHVTKYVDGRAGQLPKNIGISTEVVSGISGSELVLDREVADLVTSAIRKRFDDAGFKLVDDGSALYELGGVVKELTYNVKARDEIFISIETTLKEIATGKVIWSGVVTEKESRFAGVSGNSKSDIAIYLRNKLGVVTKKTFDAVSGTLVALHPELFNVSPGTKPVSGVTVLSAPGVSQPASGVAPVAAETSQAKTGTLVLTTKPGRAKIYLEGVYFGMSPLRAEVEVGVHEVNAKLGGYKTATEKVSIRKGETTELEMVLER